MSKTKELLLARHKAREVLDGIRQNKYGLVGLISASQDALRGMLAATDAEPEKVREVMGQLVLQADAAEELEKKTNAELAELLFQTVWTGVPILSAHSALLEVVIDRLREAPDLRGAKKEPLLRTLRFSISYLVDANNSEMVDEAKDAIWEDLDRIVIKRSEDFEQLVSLQPPPPDATEADIPEFLRESAAAQDDALQDEEGGEGSG